jgi:hypothetical protein
MWLCGSEHLAALASLISSKVKIEWLPYHHQTYDNIKKHVETKVLVTYKNFCKPFRIYSDDPDHHLCAVFMQDNSLHSAPLT